KRADRFSELQALLRVLQSIFIGPHLCARDFPPATMTGPAQHERGIAERPCAARQTIRVWDPAVLHGDLSVLHDLERDLVLNLLDAEPGRSLVLDDKALDLVIVEVACPDDRDIAPRRVADPALLAIENPGVAFAFRCCRQAASGARAHQWLSQSEAADLLHAGHRWQPLLLLLFSAVEVDGTHRQAGVNAPEGRHRGIGSRYVHSSQADQQRAS